MLEKFRQKNQNFDRKTKIFTNFNTSNQNVDKFLLSNENVDLKKPNFDTKLTYSVKKTLKTTLLHSTVT